MISAHARVERAFERLAAERFDERATPYLRIGPDDDLDEVRLGKGPSGTYRLWARLASGENDTGRSGVGTMLPVELETLATENGGTRQFLRVSCEDPRLNRTFLSLVAEMLDDVETAGTPVADALSKVIDSWRELLRSREKEMDRSEAIGLFGELVVLQQLVATEGRQALGVWRGAENYRHDFSRVNALEVKTYTGFGEPRVRIHGVHQLEPPTGHQLHLVALRIDENASGRTIADLVDELVVAGVPRGQVLRKIGTTMDELERTASCFVIEETRLFEVGPDFPGIRPSTLAESAVRGVDDLTYSLSLDLCPSPLSQNALQDVLEAL